MYQILFEIIYRALSQELVMHRDPVNAFSHLWSALKKRRFVLESPPTQLSVGQFSFITL